MNDMLQTKMNEAWDFVQRKLFCEKTNLFYDYITSHEKEKRFAHLPHSEEIEVNFPNSCGWSTGMEDCMLNAGAAMDALCCRYELNRNTETQNFAEKVLDGMFLCTHVHGVSGFVARGISPRDGKSCYINSSRDQFTLCVYAAWRFWNTFTSSPKRETAAKILVDISRYCNSVITPKNDNLLRLDGAPALVSGMVQSAESHEALRLAMFHAAAWQVTGESDFFDSFRRCCSDSAIQKTLTIDMNGDWWDIALIQLQLSLSLLMHVSPDTRFATAMRKTAILAEKVMCRELENGKSISEWSVLNGQWRQMPMLIRSETLPISTGSAFFHGFVCLNPRFPTEYNRPNWVLRSLGNTLSCMLLCEDYSIAPELFEGFTQYVGKVDFSKLGSDASLKILQAFYLGKKKNF